MKTDHFAHRIDMLDATGEIRRALDVLACVYGVSTG
jgi:hypothetical protein